MQLEDLEGDKLIHPGGDREGMWLWTLRPGENLDGRIEKFDLPKIVIIIFF